MSHTAVAEVLSTPAEAFGRVNEALCERYARTASPDALDRLVRDNQLLVHHVLKRFSAAAEPYDDLTQVANIGLIKAARSFDPERGVRFCTYATAMIDGEVRHYLRDARLMRQPRWVRRLLGQIDEATTRLADHLGRPPGISEIATAMNLTQESVREALALSARVELRSPQGDYRDGPEGVSDLDRRMFHSRRYESFALPIEDRLVLDDALDRLTDFERRLVELLFYREFTQREVAEALGVTHKKVSRELQKALRTLREVMGKRIF